LAAHPRTVQNPIYLAPEILAKEPFTERCLLLLLLLLFLFFPFLERIADRALRSDVYAFGIILYEILTGLEPFSEYGFAFEIADAVSAGKRPQIPSHFRLPIDAARVRFPHRYCCSRHSALIHP
jgi:serine/threonine protein kinase